MSIYEQSTKRNPSKIKSECAEVYSMQRRLISFPSLRRGFDSLHPLHLSGQGRMRQEHFAHELVGYIPERLEDGILYISYRCTGWRA